MIFRAVIEERAEREFADTVDFYDEHEPGLGQRFARDVIDIFREICRNPERFPRATRLTRKAKILNWPYSIYYAVKAESAEVIISAVWHGSRNPAELRQRLK